MSEKPKKETKKCCGNCGELSSSGTCYLNGKRMNRNLMGCAMWCELTLEKLKQNEERRYGRYKN